MKILITTDWYKPAVNGVVTSVVSLADGLAAEGAEVRILTLSSDLHSYTKGNVTYLGSVGVGRSIRMPVSRRRLPAGMFRN